MKVKFTVEKKLVKVVKYQRNIKGDIRRGLIAAVFYYVGDVMMNFLSGQVLNVRTGRLRSSITNSPPYKAKSGWYVEAGTNVWYGRELEVVGVGHAKTTYPFLHPALVRGRSKILKIMRTNAMRSLR